MLNVSYVGAFVPDLYDEIIMFKNIFPLQYYVVDVVE